MHREESAASIVSREDISRRGERGSVLILVVLLMALLAFIPVGAELLKTARKQVKLQANANAQAVNVARAGLTDAAAWFRMQSVQPVRNAANPDSAFYPRYSAGPATDTLDESIGLVKEFQLGEENSLYGRYEVVRQSTATAYNAHAVHDVTDARVDNGTAGSGLAWYIESVGYVFQKKDPSAAYNAAPNVIVGRARVSTELRRLALATSNAAVVIDNRANGNVGANCRVTGGTGLGVGYRTGSGGTWTGTTGGFSSGYTISVSSTFGVGTTELQLMADYSSMAQLPASYPTMSLVYVNGNAVFDSARKLTGSGVLFVNGNLTIQSSANAVFSGLIFVTGNVTIYGQTLISGTVMLMNPGSTLTMVGTSGVAEIQNDQGILNAMRQQVGQYRENKSAYHVFSALK